ncbi:Polyamine-modulated factor 1 [Plecturocebus cupreus]
MAEASSANLGGGCEGNRQEESSPESVPSGTTISRVKLLDTMVDTFLQKLVAAGSPQSPLYHSSAFVSPASICFCSQPSWPSTPSLGLKCWSPPALWWTTCETGLQLGCVQVTTGEEGKPWLLFWLP